MRVKLFALTYGNKRQELLTKNLLCAGYDYDYRYIEISPLHSALNFGLLQLNDYDAIMFLANDIEEPNDWLKLRVEKMESDKSIGIVSIYPSLPPIPHGADLIGNYLISSKLITEIGYFSEAYGDYGPIDLDYCNRARLAGFKTEYVDGVTAEHKDWNTDMAYGYSKKEHVDKVWPQYNNDIANYNSGLKSIKNFNVSS